MNADQKNRWSEWAKKNDVSEPKASFIKKTQDYFKANPGVTTIYVGGEDFLKKANIKHGHNKP